MIRSLSYLLSMVAGGALSLSAPAQQSLDWNDFLDTIGGSENVGDAGGDSALIARPLADNASKIIAARFFKKSAKRDPFLVTDSVVENFAKSCAAQSGTVLDQSNQRAQQFAQRVISHLTPPTQTGVEASELALALMITKNQLASVIDVSPSSLSLPRLSHRTKERLGSLVDVFNRAIFMAQSEKRAAFWMNHEHPQGMGPESPLDWIVKGKSEMVRAAQEAVLAGGYQ